MGEKDEKRIFNDLLSLVGKTVEVGVASSRARLRGEVRNAMFDSFILETETGKQIIRFEDILFLDEMSSHT